MGLTLTAVHETARDPNTGLDRVTRENPYVRLKQGEFPPLYIQGGNVYDESGNPQKNLPDWFMEELAKAEPAQLARAGWKQKAEPAQMSKSQLKRLEVQKSPRRKTSLTQPEKSADNEE